METNNKLPYIISKSLPIVLEVTMRDGNVTYLQKMNSPIRFRSDYEGWKRQPRQEDQGEGQFAVLEVTMRDGNKIF